MHYTKNQTPESCSFSSSCFLPSPNHGCWLNPDWPGPRYLFISAWTLSGMSIPDSLPFLSSSPDSPFRNAVSVCVPFSKYWVTWSSTVVGSQSVRQLAITIERLTPILPFLLPLLLLLRLPLLSLPISPSPRNLPSPPGSILLSLPYLSCSNKRWPRENMKEHARISPSRRTHNKEADQTKREASS